jgi:hypothetical protein
LWADRATVNSSAAKPTQAFNCIRHGGPRPSAPQKHRT